jgi:hypothetical protein
VYPLLDNKETFRFQRLVTRYQPYARIPRVDCSITSKNKKVRVIWRDKQIEGTGEVQLWLWPEQKRSNAPLSSTSTTSASAPLPRAGSIASSVQSIQTARGGSLRTDFRGKEQLVSSLSAPPVIACFTQDACRGRYSMMKTGSKLAPFILWWCAT